jgi:hypothetical protein
VALDLLEALGSAEVVQQSAGQPVVRSAFDAAAGVHEAGGVRPVILAAAPSRLRYTVPVAAGSTLEFAIGVHPWKGWKKGGDGLTFAVEIEGQRVWQRRLDPARVFDDRGWTPGRVDLTPWDGQTVALELVTEPGDDAAFDLGGWSDIAIVSRASTPRLAAGDAPTLVLVVVDTLRADRLGCYGGGVATPRIDALAARGVRFATARAASSWTWPATSSILTGLYPGAHGVRDYQRCLLVEGLDTLPELCMRRGYTTGGFVANALIAADNNFDQGFETFVCAPNVTARALNARVAAWLADTEGCARFLYVHYMDPHLPYLPPPRLHPAGGRAARLQRGGRGAGCARASPETAPATRTPISGGAGSSCRGACTTPRSPTSTRRWASCSTRWTRRARCRTRSSCSPRTMARSSSSTG